MALHNQLGKEGEKLAEQFLQDKGYKILHKNWRFSRYEIDIIASYNDKLHIIEVKTLHETSAGHPEDAVNKAKFKRLQRATDWFLYKHPRYRDVQYDILAITLLRTGKKEYFFIEDVFL